MRMLTSFCALLLLAACGDQDQPGEDLLVASEDGIECAVDGAGAFERVCTLEREEGPEGTTLTIRHPSGGFRRLMIAGNGVVTAADGFDAATVTVSEDKRTEVTLAGDRYRLPTGLKGSAL